MFDENNFTDVACTLKLQVINSSYLKVTSATKLFSVITQCLKCNYRIFLFEEKMFRSRDIKIFVFMRNLQISKFVTSS